ncbi:MAG: hypothetical protein ACK5DE_12355 [Bacteroidota bacterium]|jgi:hypothetical protein
MKKVIVKNKDGIIIAGSSEYSDPTAWIEDCVANNYWGQSGDYTIEIEDITDQVEQERINAEATEYLASTDWMVIREMDAGVPCPAEVKAERAAARARIVR